MHLSSKNLPRWCRGIAGSERKWYAPPVGIKSFGSVGQTEDGKALFHIGFGLTGYDGPWQVEMVLGEVRGRMVVVETWIGPPEPTQSGIRHLELPTTIPDDLPDAGLTAQDLRTLHIGEVLRRLQELEDKDQLGILPKPTRVWFRESARKQQGRAKDEDFYAQVASDYLNVIRTHPAKPAIALAELYRKERGRRNTKPTEVSTWVNQARRYGWLTPSRRGVVGGEPTDKLLEWQKKQRRGRRKGGRK